MNKGLTRVSSEAAVGIRGCLSGVLIFLGPLILASSSYADAITEKGERAEVNWSALEVRYFGEAAPGDDDKDSFKGTERRAWQDGISAIEETLTLLSDGRIGMHVSAPKGAATSGGSGATSRSTTYFGDGKVRVYLQSPLQKIVVAALGEVAFREKSELAALKPATASYSGVVIQLEQKLAPLAVYKLTDPSGQKLFGIEDMTEEGFRSSLMGRWVRRAGDQEIAAYAGDKPLIIKAKIGESRNQIIVDPDTWKSIGQEAAYLMASGNVLIAVP